MVLVAILRGVQPPKTLLDAFAEAYSSGRFEAIEPHLHEDVVFDFSRSRSPYRGTYEGREAVGRLFADIREAWDTVEWTVDEIVDLDENRAVLQTRMTGQGRISGVELSARGAQVWTVRDGKIARMELHQSREEAIRAAGDEQA